MLVRLDVTVWRGSIPESRHRIQAVAMPAQGPRLLETADTDRATTFRSAAKPFQLLPLVERGHAERWKFNDEEVAVMCSSHTGAARHLELVRGILERIGVAETELACGYHDPLDPDSLAHTRAHPLDRSPVYNNCSGKHAGMLCLAVSEGWPRGGYERLGHPVQQLMRRTVAEMCGVTPESMGVAVDGCSVPVFALPLSAMALGYARFAAARAEGDARARALDRIRRAMMSYPRATGGEARFSSRLMEAAPGRWVAKGGAEGLECLGWNEPGVGIAIKAEDGATRPLAPAMHAVLERIGAIPEGERAAFETWRRPVFHNAAGLEVGSIEAQVEIRAPAAR